MTALSDALSNPDVKIVVLAEVTSGSEVRTWTLDTGTTYYTDALFEISNITEDGASLTERTTLADCRNNTGSWFYDQAASRVYVNPTSGASPYSKTIQRMYQFYFSSHAVIFNNNYYEPRIKNVPSLNMRIESKFTGVQQVGGGTIELNNEDGYFDSIVDFQWRAGTTTIKIGADHRSAMQYADYETIGTWINEEWSADSNSFSLSLTEFKIRARNKIPASLYSRSEYPLIRETDIGRAVQAAYGKIMDANPVCIDVNTRTFKLAGHEIKSIETIRVKNESTGVWEQKNAATTDLVNATFTMSSADWQDGRDIAVDFIGKKTGLAVMDNASDVVKDILQTYLLEPSSNIDASSFSAAHSDLDVGQFFNSDDRHTAFPVAVYIDKQTQADKIIGEINSSVGAYIFANSSGKYFYKVFVPARGEGLTEYADDEIIDLVVFKEAMPKTSSTVKYLTRISNDWSESKTYTDQRYKYINNLPNDVLSDRESVLSSGNYALHLAQYIVQYEGPNYIEITITVPSRSALTINPSDFVLIRYSNPVISGVFEVTSVRTNLSSNKTNITLGNLHGLSDRPGFWVGDSDTLPSRFADLAGYGSGSLTWNNSWHDDIKNWARQNVGYWTDDNGFADPADTKSRDLSSWV